MGPIHSPDDLVGSTIRATGNLGKSITNLGGTPADVSMADCYEAIRTGVVDGIMTIHHFPLLHITRRKACMNDFKIPVLAPKMPKAEHDFPISPRENLMRAFRHEKPMYVPCLYQASQFYIPRAFAEENRRRAKNGKDWFGTNFIYEESQEGVTAVPPYVLEDICDWRELIKWPDIKSMDWGPDDPDFVRDEKLALACRCLWHGTFESIHFLEGFEQGLMDLFSEPEECKDFFMRMAQFKADMFDLQNEKYKFDYVCHNDDWSNAKSQMFSCELFEETLLEPHMLLSEAVRKTGAHYMVHCCGKMEAWLPYIVNDLKADMVEIQSINDTKYIMDTYGDRLTVEYSPDFNIMYNPRTTAQEAREYARSLVDRYGAHKNKGSGFVVHLHGNIPESYYAFEDELYNYSLKMYKNQ